ncbi:Rossmann-like and DUF2520 domain-containing protein [Haloimpatiens sp. FM7330]|uniref:Rossmann-like and DUF2520 domain-containing protein n=1 Tax=Haloimpatiens sp. FM7330 TaxID=3298610 RepID=UPI0036370240
MKIGFIGAGKVGCSLGKYFAINNLSLSGYYSKSFHSSKQASDFTNSKAHISLKSLVKSSNIIFITTPDDDIENVWKDVRELNIKDKIICHTSGSLSSNIFSDINISGAFGYSIHPMYPFCDKFNSFNLNNVHFSIEGNVKHITFIKNLINSLGNTVHIIDGDKKYLYHLSNVMASNLVLAILNTSCEYLKKLGMSTTDCIDALMPLIFSNINNIKNNKDFIKSLTGPIERCDINTVSNHLKVIPKEDIALYKTLSLKLLNLSEIKHSQRDYSKLYSILGGIKNEKNNTKL